MLKSQITKGHHNTPVKRIGKAFPDTEEGRSLLLAYAASQLGVEQKASLQIDLSDTIDNFDYELIYRLYDNSHISMPERITSLCVVDGKIIVPSILPRTVRNYIRMDVRLGYLEFQPIHSTDIHLNTVLEDQVKKLKEKYPSKTEEEIRQGLENWIK